MSEPGTAEWFRERGMPAHVAAELATVEAGGHGCTPSSVGPNTEVAEISADELAGLGDEP